MKSARILQLNKSLPDFAFYPLAVLLAGLMIFLALAPYEDRKPSGPMSGAGGDVSHLIVSGDDLYRFVAGEAGTIGLEEIGETVLLRITLRAGEIYDLVSYGPNLPLESDLERQYAGKRIKVTVRARYAGDFPAEFFEANYSTGRTENSGWRRFELGPAFQDYSFVYAPPAADAQFGQDYLGVRPVAPEKRRTIEVSRIEFQIEK